MLPYVTFLGIDFSTYGFFTAVGIILFTLSSLFLSKKYSISHKDIILSVITTFIFGFLGAHLLYALVNAPKMLPLLINYPQNFFAIIQSWVSGMVFYGGLIGGILGGLIYCKARKLHLPHFSDTMCVSIPLFHCFGRIGCFFSGCCYGIESSFGFTTTSALISSCNYVNRFPVQLLEAGLNLLLFAILFFFFKKNICQGKLLYIYLIIYSIIRFFDEFLRGDIYRGIWLGLSTSQWISIFLLIFAVIMIIISTKNNKKQDRCYYEKM